MQSPTASASAPQWPVGVGQPQPPAAGKVAAAGSADWNEIYANANGSHLAIAPASSFGSQTPFLAPGVPPGQAAESHAATSKSALPARSASSTAAVAAPPPPPSSSSSLPSPLLAMAEAEADAATSPPPPPPAMQRSSSSMTVSSSRKRRRVSSDDADLTDDDSSAAPRGSQSRRKLDHPASSSLSSSSASASASSPSGHSHQSELSPHLLIAAASASANVAAMSAASSSYQGGQGDMSAASSSYQGGQGQGDLYPPLLTNGHQTTHGPPYPDVGFEALANGPPASGTFISMEDGPEHGLPAPPPLQQHPQHSRKQRFTPGQKEKILDWYFSKENVQRSFLLAARKCGVDKATLKRWVHNDARYDGKSQGYAAEFKRQVLDWYFSPSNPCISYSVSAEQCGIGKKTLKRWARADPRFKGDPGRENRPKLDRPFFGQNSGAPKPPRLGSLLKGDPDDASTASASTPTPGGTDSSSGVPPPPLPVKRMNKTQTAAKYTSEFRLAVVEYYFSIVRTSANPRKETSKKFDVPVRTIEKWRLRRLKETTNFRSKERRKYSAEFRQEVVNWCAANTAVYPNLAKRASEMFNVPFGTLSKWLRQSEEALFLEVDKNGNVVPPPPPRDLTSPLLPSPSSPNAAASVASVVPSSLSEVRNAIRAYGQSLVTVEQHSSTVAGTGKGAGTGAGGGDEENNSSSSNSNADSHIASADANVASQLASSSAASVSASDGSKTTSSSTSSSMSSSSSASLNQVSASAGTVPSATSDDVETSAASSSSSSSSLSENKRRRIGEGPSDVSSVGTAQNGPKVSDESAATASGATSAAANLLTADQLSLLGAPPHQLPIIPLPLLPTSGGDDSPPPPPPPVPPEGLPPALPEPNLPPALPTLLPLPTTLDGSIDAPPPPPGLPPPASISPHAQGAGWSPFFDPITGNPLPPEAIPAYLQQADLSSLWGASNVTTGAQSMGLMSSYLTFPVSAAADALASMPPPAPAPDSNAFAAASASSPSLPMRPPMAEKAQHRRYPVKFQKEVVAWYDAYRKQHGVSIVDTARAFNVPRGTVAFWIYKHRDHVPKSRKPKRPFEGVGDTAAADASSRSPPAPAPAPAPAADHQQLPAPLPTFHGEAAPPAPLPAPVSLPTPLPASMAGSLPAPAPLPLPLPAPIPGSAAAAAAGTFPVLMPAGSG